MLRTGPILAIVALAAVLTVPAAAAPRTPLEPQESTEQDSGFTLVPRITFWRPSLRGTVRITKASVDGTGTDAHVDRDLDVDPASAWQLGLDVLYGPHRLRLHYEPMRFSGDAIVDEPFVFHGVRYETGTHVASDLELIFYEASYDYLLLDGEVVDLRAGGGIYYWQSFNQLEANGSTEKRTITQLVPTIATALDGTWAAFKFGGTAMLGTLGPDRQMIDLTAYGGLEIADRIELDLGYRWMDFDFKTGTNDADLVAQGPYLALSVQF